MNAFSHRRFPRCSSLCEVSGMLIMTMLFSACASNHSKTLSDVLDEDALAAEIVVSGPIEISTDDKTVRRTAGVAQAGILYSRSVYVDPINRPVSNLLSLSSIALKSAGGLFRRIAIGTAGFSSLDGQEIPEVSNAEGMDLEKWEKDLDKISGQKRERGTIGFLVDGNEYFPRLMEAFANARHSIDIRTYIFDNDDYAVHVADYLKHRSQDVKIRVMFDALGNLLAMQSDADFVPADYAAPLSMESYLEQNSKIRVRSRANPWLTGDHTKTTIIDGKTAFVGGMNIGREYRYQWHDLMMEVSGPIVDRLQYDSDKAWARASILGDVANFFRFLAGRKHRADDQGYAIRPLYTRNFDSQIYRAQLEAIRRSRSYILIENAYFSDDTILFELAKARGRGVDVRVILPLSGNHGALNASNRVAINRMLQYGIRVYLYPGMSHVKAAIFDGWACVGSANFDKLSLEINKELNLATSENAAVQELLDRLFLPDLAGSKEVNEPLDLGIQAKLLEFAADEFL